MYVCIYTCVHMSVCICTWVQDPSCTRNRFLMSECPPKLVTEQEEEWYENMCIFSGPYGLRRDLTPTGCPNIWSVISLLKSLFKKSWVQWHACDHSSGEGGWTLGLFWPMSFTYPVNSRPIRDPVSKKQVEWLLRNDTQCWPQIYPHK